MRALASFPRGGAALGLGLALAAGACGERSAPSGATGTAGSDAGAAYRADPRIAELLAPCPYQASRFYDRDTSDLLPVLLEKLESGKVEPIRRAKEELGAMGARSVEGLRRLIERASTDAFLSAVAENGLEALGLNPASESRGVLLRMLDHPQDSVRATALSSLLAAHVRPEDFDVLLAHVESAAESPELRRKFAVGLFASDPVRAARQVAEWLGERVQRELWQAVLPLFARSDDAEVAAAAASLQGSFEPRERGWVAAPAARAGDPDALAFLRGETLAELAPRRTLAVRALAAAGRRDELFPVLASDPDPTIRMLAAQAIGEEDGAWTADRRDDLRAALDDESPLVRTLALELLVAHEDSAAIDRALVFLGGPPELLQAALSALRPRWSEDEALARRAFELLVARDAREVGRPLAQRAATLKAIGLVPLAEAARLLLERADADGGDGAERIEGLRPHRWLMIQAANTGPGGREVLRERLQAEDAPARRIDLIWAIGASRTDAARAALLEICETEARSPYEALFAADLLTRIGPSSAVAPRLKRVTYAIEQEDVRLALQCLLWLWY